MKNKLNRNGFTYLMALMLIMIMGVMLGVVGQSWKTIMQREREEELIFRGRQIKSAIEDWNNTKNKQNHPPTKLNELEHLVKDPRVPSVKRRLRRIYKDPMTDKEWNLIIDPVKGIIGVASTSQAKPLKTGGFPDDLKDLTEKQKYSDWLFMTTPGPNTAQGGAPGAGGRPNTSPTTSGMPGGG